MFDEILAGCAWCFLTFLEVGREMTISGAMPWVPWIRGGIFDKGMSTFSDIFS